MMFPRGCPSLAPTRPSAGLQLRLFLTCWLIFVVHFAPDIVREHFLAFSLAEACSFRVDRYRGLHVDLFETPGRGVHINNNPGASMLAAIPYSVFRPVIDLIAGRVNTRRAAAQIPVSATYRVSDQRKVDFFRQVRARGLDVQLVLAAGVMQAFFMAPFSAAAAVLMLRILMGLGVPWRRGLLFAFLYAVGTPIFFRTAYLNHNLLVAHLTLFGFAALWRADMVSGRALRGAGLSAGFAGGLAMLADYSGAIVLAWLGLYAAVRGFDCARWPGVRRGVAAIAAGASLPVLTLLFYQWRCFGSPWFPAQHYRRPSAWAPGWYRGVTLPQWDLFAALMIDPRFGLFVACPLLALAAVGFVLALRRRGIVARREAVFLAGLSVAMVVFFSGVEYTRKEWVSGIRYLSPVVPCLFLLTVPALERLWRPVLYVVVVAAVFQAWCLSMARSTYVLDSLASVVLTGFQLPWMNVLARTGSQYLPVPTGLPSPVPLFVLVAALIAIVWWRPKRWRGGSANNWPMFG